MDDDTGMIQLISNKKNYSKFNSKQITSNVNIRETISLTYGPQTTNTHTGHLYPTLFCAFTSQPQSHTSTTQN